VKTPRKVWTVCSVNVAPSWCCKPANAVRKKSRITSHTPGDRTYRGNIDNVWCTLPCNIKTGMSWSNFSYLLGRWGWGLDFRLLSLTQTVYHQTLHGRQSSMKLISINNQNLNKCKFHILVWTTINFMRFKPCLNICEIVLVSLTLSCRTTYIYIYVVQWAL